MKDNYDRPLTPHAMDRMAETLGLNIDAEYDANLVSRRQLDRAVERCHLCADPDGCEIWLDDHAGGAKQAPALCPNKALFDHLRAGW